MENGTRGTNDRRIEVDKGRTNKRRKLRFTTLQIEDIRSEIERLTVEIDKLEKERARIDELINPAKRERESWQFIYSRRVAESEQVTVMTAIPDWVFGQNTPPLFSISPSSTLYYRQSWH